MAEDTDTGYVVLHEVPLERLQGDIILAEGTRIFVTDSEVVSANSGDQAIRGVIEGANADANPDDLAGAWATCPARSWKPEEWEVDLRPTARKKRS